MQVTGGTGKEFGGYSKTDLARDPTKNIDSAGRYISNIMSTENTADPGKIGTVYNGSSQYGQRIEAQINNPNYNTNIFSNTAQKIGASIQKNLKKK